MQSESFLPGQDLNEANRRLFQANEELNALKTDLERRVQERTEELAERVGLLALGADIGVALAQGDTLQHMLQACAVGLVQHLNAAFARIWTLNVQEGVLELRASAGLYTHLDGPHSKVPVGKYKIGQIALERSPHLTNSVVGDPRVSDQDWAKREGMIAFAGYPLIVDERAVGVMAVFARHPLSVATLDAMKSVANGIALGVERKQTEQQIRQSEAALADFFDNATVGLHWVGADGTILRANKSELDMLGYSREEYVGHPIAEFHVDADVICDILSRLQAGEQLHEYHARLRCKDGSIKLVLIDSSVMFKDGDFVNTRCFTRDVTQHKRAETLLACQNKALKMVVEGMPLANILDFLMRTIEAESTAGVIAAIHLLDSTGHFFVQAIAPSLPQSYHQATQIAVDSQNGPCCRAVSTRKPVTVPDVLNDSQWTAFAGFAGPLGILSCWSAPIFSSAGKVLGTFANYYRQNGGPNVDDRQLVEVVTRTATLAIEGALARDAVRQSEQIARFLSAASGSLAELTDYESTLQRIASLAVPDFADWCAVDVQDADGSVRRLAVSHSDPAKVRLAQELFRCYPPQQSDRYGVMNVLRTGQAEWVPMILDAQIVETSQDDEHLRMLRELGLKSYLCVPFQSHGKMLGTLTFVTAESGRIYDSEDLRAAEDLASRAAIAVENARLVTKLKDSDRRKDEFLATLAHELRNPLAPIRNGLQVMRLAGSENEMVSEARSMMERQLSQMVRLVDDLLDVSRISQNKLDLRKEKVTLATVVHSAVETSRPLFEQANHTFSVTLPPAPVNLHADSVRLAQVFSNLLNNSAKYTEPGGRIWLVAEIVQNEVVVRVRDNGLGIPTESLPRIFELFSQVDCNLERSQGGLGIGLTLVRRLVEMHGGSVEAHSDGPGRGSEFSVHLPLLEEKRPDHAAHADGDQATKIHLKRRILIVDDNHDSAISLGMMLKLMGNETHIAHDGLAAVEAASEFRPDIVLLDIGLPKLNGYDACRRIRAEPWSNGMVIVALTGWGQDDDRRRSAEAGFNHHLVKPVEVVELEKLIGELKQS